MIDLNLPLTYRENANLIYAISYFYTLLVSLLIWSIWRFIKAILSLKPENIKLKAEERLAKHYAEIRRFKQIERIQKRELNQNIFEVESQKQENIPDTRKRKKNSRAAKKDGKTKIKNVEKK
uniref:ATP synthase F0 subunit 8 n=1 Tax=Panagrolaimus sp. PS1159 TaxID=55785 RepID=A0AC35GH11_9BILA